MDQNSNSTLSDQEDVVVAGGGMAGLVAAMQARQEGASVLLLEKSDHSGGSMALAGGLLWTAPDLTAIREKDPEGDPVLQKLLVDRFADGLAWLRQLGVQFGPALDDRQEYGTGFWIAPRTTAAVYALQNQFEASGGRVQLGTSVSRLQRDGDGVVRGVEARQSGRRHQIASKAVVLCTGGFQGNPDLLTRYVGRWADRMVLRSNPCSVGDGLLMALEAGAGTSRGLHRFYGHLMPAPPARTASHLLPQLSQYQSVHCLLLNLRGLRFVDEALGDALSAQELAQQPQAAGFLVFDEEINTRCVLQMGYRRQRPGEPNVDKVNAVLKAGGRVAVAPTLRQLVDQMALWGVDGRAALATIEEYNKAVAEGQSHRLPIPRSGNAHMISHPPFICIPVIPGITFTLGGLCIDAEARVLDRDGIPVEGLYAAGADAGGVYYQYYSGGLALGLVFGRIAGSNAARRAASLEK